MSRSLGKTLLIANPAAQNGKGITAALYAEEWMKGKLSSNEFDLVMTEGPQHGYDLAKEAFSFDTVIALGGDGLIHEVANGLMAIRPEYRPALGVLPAGSGNDFARTIGMSFDIETSTAQIMEASAQPLDLGCCNGQYYVETLSFGLDAAIALDTVDTRKSNGQTGTHLFLRSGIDLLLHGIHHYPFVATLKGDTRADCDTRVDGATALDAETGIGVTTEVDGDTEADVKTTLDGEMLIFAVQNGPTYGGGFRICPDAQSDDGLLDICIARPPMGTIKALYTFLRAKNARHVNSKHIEFHRCSSMHIAFEGEPPAQIDGEPIPAPEYEISVEKHALSLLVP